MLAQRHRIVKGDDYRHLVRTGKRINSSTCVLHVTTTEPSAPARFGFIVTRAVGKAHTRNQVRRRYKALCLELIRAGLRGKDIVVRVHPRSAIVSFSELRVELLEAIERNNLIADMAPEFS